MSILLGDATGNFSGATNFAAGDTPWSVAVGDFNGDGKQDLAVGNVNTNKVSTLLGDGIGNFTAPTNSGVGNFPQSVAVGDFNGDGKQDLAVANDSLNHLSILLRDCALTPTSAVSRKQHGSDSVYDIDLPVTGATGIECRSGGLDNVYQVVVTFLNPVTFSSASVTSGTGDGY